jgi:hypothetical protein
MVSLHLSDEHYKSPGPDPFCPQSYRLSAAPVGPVAVIPKLVLESDLAELVEHLLRVGP